MNMPVLEVRNAKKRYGPVQAVADVSLQLTEGRILCLLGPSGSGKTSLLRLVAGLERLDGGEILVSGGVVDDAKRRFVASEQRTLGMVFQDYALWPHLNVADNVGLPLRERKLMQMIPAVVQENGSTGIATSRIHLVDRDHNPLYHRMIGMFGEKTGTPVVLNTSFNVRGEPIVCTPEDALRCFFSTGMDDLLLGPFHIRK